MNKLKRNLKKSIACFICLTMVLVDLPARNVQGAEIINPNPLIDIIVNPCADYSKTYEEFSQDLAEALNTRYENKKALYESDGDATTNPSSVPSIEDVRISQAGIQLNTLDLAEWYVYDHYNAAETNTTLAANTTGIPSGWNNYGGKRPYFGYKTSYGSKTLTTIENYVAGTTMYEDYNVQALDRHILSSVDEYGKASMTFCGYGDNAYNDFLFYPASTRYKKHISFDFDAANVRIHSMTGSGFLINTGVDTHGYLQGYLLYIDYVSSLIEPTIILYRLGGNQTPEAIHQATNGINGINKTEVNRTSFALDSTTMKGKLIIDISTDYLTVQQQPYTDDNGGQGEVQTVFNNVGINTTQFPYTNYNGFGPIVCYSGHSCGQTSFFVYSDLAMSYQTDSFEAIRNSQFAHDRADGTVVSRYFLNLADSNPEIPEVASEYKEGLRRMVDDEIKYISNVQDSTDVTGSTTTVATTLGDNNTFYATNQTYEEYIESIADYIVTGTAWDEGSVDTPLLVAPAAKFTIVGKESTAPDSDYVQTLSIHLKHLQDSNGTIKITFDDTSYPVDTSRPIVRREYTIRDANGVIQATKTVNTGDADTAPPYILISGSSPEGTYTMSLLVTDSEGVASTSSTLPFTVLNDKTAPEIIIDSSTTQRNKATVTITDNGSGVKKYKIGNQEEENLVTIRSKATVTVDVPQDGTGITIQAWDECGNTSSKTLSTNAITYYTGLSDTTTVYAREYVLNNCFVGVLPAAPVDADGIYGFAGWFTSTQRTTAFSTSQKITQNTSVYGKWSDSRVMIHFNPNGGTIDGRTEIKDLNVVSGTLFRDAALQISEPVRNGYDFTGWTLDGNAMGSTAATVSKTLIAGWKLGKVTLTLDPNGGTSGSLSKLSDTNGTKITTVLSNYGTTNTNPSKSGYTFSKWQIKNADGSFRDLASSDVLGDNGATIYACWTRDYMQFTGKSMTNGSYAASYREAIQATNGTGKFVYSIVNDSSTDAYDQLPAGLTLNPTTGEVTGTITGNMGTYSFDVKAEEQPNSYVTETDASMTKTFTLVVTTGARPTVANKTVNLKYDATDKESVVKGLYDKVVGVTRVETAPISGGVEGVDKYNVTVYFDANCGGGSQEVTVTANLVKPELELAVPSIDAISALSTDNATEATLLAYLNTERELVLKENGNANYAAALGTMPSSWTLPEYDFADESSNPSKEYSKSGNVYHFTQNYMDTDIERELIVNPVNITFQTETIRKFIDDASFDPGFDAIVLGNALEGTAVTYSIPDENVTDNVVSISNNLVKPIAAGTTQVMVTGTKEYYTTGNAVFNVIVSTKPKVQTGTAQTNLTEKSTILNGQVVLGTENTTENGLVATGFKYKRTGDNDYIDVPAQITGNSLQTQIQNLEVGTEYTFYTYCKTLTGEIDGDLSTFKLQNTTLVKTDSYSEVTATSAILSGTVQSGNVTGKGFEYRVYGDASYTSHPINMSEATQYTATGLLPATKYQFRTYAVVGGVRQYGDVLTFTTESKTNETPFQINNTDENITYTPDTEDENSYHVVIDPDSNTLKVAGTNESDSLTESNFDNVVYVTPIDPSNPEDLANPDNQINIDLATGEVQIGKNISKVDLEFTFSDGRVVSIHVVRGSVSVGIENESVVVESSVDKNALLGAVNPVTISSYVNEGSSVDVQLVVQDVSEENTNMSDFKGFIEQNIYNYAHVHFLEIKVKQTLDNDPNQVSYISKLTEPVFIELEVDENALTDVRDIRVVHEKAPGTYEIFNVVKNNNKIGFWAQEFSPYALVYVNQYAVGVEQSGEGTVTPSRDSLSLLEGESVSFVIAAAKYYHVESVLDNGTEVAVEDSYAIEQIDKNHSLEVNFVKDKFGITASSNGGESTITPSGTTYVEAQESITYHFAQKKGYELKSVIVDGVDLGGNLTEYTFSNVTEGHTIQLVFAKQTTIKDDETNDDGTKDNPSKNDTDENPNGSDVQTGDDFMPLPVIFVSLMSLLAIVFMTIKKYQQHK